MGFRVFDSLHRGGTWCAGKVDFFLVQPLTGKDGRLSFAKLMTVFVAGCFAFNRPIPSAVALALLAAPYGLKGLEMVLDKTRITANSSDTSITEKREITQKLYERRSTEDGTEPTP